MSTEFCQLDIVAKFIINVLEMMAARHAVARYLIDHGGHFPYILYGEREGTDLRGVWQ